MFAAFFVFSTPQYTYAQANPDAGDVTTGLVGHWKLNETSGPTAIDSGPLGLNGSYSGDIAPADDSVAGKIGTAINPRGGGFNGAIELGSNPSLIANTEFTVSVWVRREEDYTGISGIVESSDFIRLRKAFSSGAMQLSLPAWDGTDGFIFNIGSMPLNEWRHYVVTYNYSDPVGTLPRVYINGVENSSISWSNTPTGNYVTPTANLRLHRRYDSTNSALRGAIDDVRIYDRALSPDDVALLYRSYPGQQACNAAHEAVMWFNHDQGVMQYCNGTEWVSIGVEGSGVGIPTSPSGGADTTTGLVGHWALNETGVTTTAVDSSSTGANGIMQSTLDGTSSVSGQIGTALNFTSPNEVINIPANAAYDVDEFTVSMWLRTTQSCGSVAVFNCPGIVSKAPGSPPAPTDIGWYITSARNSGGIGITLLDGTSSDTTSSNTDINNNTWRHVAVVKTSSEVRIYIDGILDNNDNHGLGSTVGAEILEIGNGVVSGSNNSYDGDMDDFRFYNRALSLEDIQALYLGTGASLDPPGYFVMVGNQPTNAEANEFTGNLGGLSGADSTCLSYLTSNNWLGRSNADAFGMLTASNVRAWLCDDTTCQDMLPNSTYAFAKTEAGEEFMGGERFTTDANGYFPATTDDWNDDDEFSRNTDFWTGRAADFSASGQSCNNWTSDNGADSGDHGRTDATDPLRWSGTSNTCDTTDQFICIVDPPTGSSGPVGTGSTGCTSPTGKAGEMSYNLAEGVMQYCNGSNWINMGPQLAAGGVSADTLSPQPTTNGLIGHWPLEDTNTTVAAAVGPNGIMRGGLDGATNSTSGVIGNALDLDATNDSIELGNTAVVNNIFTTGGTFSAWYNVGEGIAASDRFFDKNQAGPSNRGYLANEQSGVLRFARHFTGTQGIWETTGAIPTTGWLHLVVTYDASSTANDPEIYFNGVAQTLTEISTPVGTVRDDSAHILHVGNRNDLNRAIGVDIDDIRIYDRMLDADETVALYRASSLIGHWRLDDTTGTTAVNSVNPGTNDGTVNGTDFDTDSVAGVNGTAMNFDGSGDRVNLGQMPSIVGSSTLSISFWFKPDDLPTGGLADGLVIQIDDYDNVIGCRLDGNDDSLWCYVEIANIPSVVKIPYASLTAGIWQHVTYTFDTGTSDIYLNGLLIDNVTSGTTTSLPDLTNDMYLGFTEAGPGFYYDGALDDVRIYNRALSEAEVGQLYALTGGGAAPITGCPNIGDTCDDGSIYAGLSPDGDVAMYTTPADAGTARWSPNGAVYTPTGATDFNTGSLNTEIITATDSDSGTGGVQNHPAAEMCNNLSDHGHTDWYLPAQSELIRLYNNLVVTAGMSGFNNGFWSSTESATHAARSYNFTTASALTFNTKNTIANVRCVRTGSTVVGGACSNPRGVAGEIVYNDDFNVMQFCNGSEWVGMTDTP